jgi:hypothetical protein
MEASLQTAILLMPFVGIGIFRNIIIDTIGSSFFGSITSYKKSRFVDVGFVIMVISIEIGVILIDSFSSISIDYAVIIVILFCIVGAVFLATGLRDEWEKNH